MKPDSLHAWPLTDLRLDFGPIQGNELKLDPGTRTWVLLVCMQFVAKVEERFWIRPYNAETSRKKARDIAVTAQEAAEQLGRLLADANEAAAHGLVLFRGRRYSAYLSSIRDARRVARRVAAAASRRARERQAPGRPSHSELKSLIADLYRGYQSAGGKGPVTWDRRHKRYRGLPLFFVRRVLDQVLAAMPVGVAKGCVPDSENAVNRTIAGVIREFRKPPSRRPISGGFLPHSGFGSGGELVIRSRHEQRSRTG